MAIKLADTTRPNNYVDSEHLGSFPVAWAADVWFEDGTRLSEKTFDGQSIQKDELPLASIDELGNIYQYTGADGTYHNGYFYQCVSDGEDPATYSWVAKPVQSGGGGGSYTAGDGITIDNDVISTDNMQEGDMDDVIYKIPANGGIQYEELPEPSEDLLGKIYQYVGPDDDPLENGYYYECVSDGEATPTYSWEQKNVQPGGGGGDSSLTSNVTSNLAVGAIASGTTLPEGTTFTEFVQKLLITEIAPTIGFSISKSGNVAQGTSYTETLTVNVSNMGTAKKIKTIEWYEGSTLKQTDTIDSTTTGSWTYTMPTATTATTTFKAIVKYTKSNDVDDQQTKTASITFYFNKFYGAVSDLNPTEATVEALTSALATAKGGTYSFTVSAGRICYAYPKSLGALTSIKDGNGFSLFDSFTRTEQTYTQAGQSVAYYRYVLTDATTVSGYSVVFA